MLRVALQSALAFFRGRLFRHNRTAYALLALGVTLTAAVLVAGARLGLPLWAAAALAGLVGGLLQPRLYKNVKYR